MSTLAAMPMQMRMGSVAPDARVRATWQRAAAPVSAGLGLSGLGSSYVRITGDANPAFEIKTTATEAHGVRRSQESST
jgi:hypothetical protein